VRSGLIRDGVPILRQPQLSQGSTPNTRGSTYRRRNICRPRGPTALVHLLFFDPQPVLSGRVQSLSPFFPQTLEGNNWKSHQRRGLTFGLNNPGFPTRSEIGQQSQGEPTSIHHVEDHLVVCQFREHRSGQDGVWEGSRGWVSWKR
jgi:hypothetical protein